MTVACGTEKQSNIIAISIAISSSLQPPKRTGSVDCPRTNMGPDQMAWPLHVLLPSPTTTNEVAVGDTPKMESDRE